jgi:hypothetical protein
VARRAQSHQQSNQPSESSVPVRRIIGGLLTVLSLVVTLLGLADFYFNATHPSVTPPPADPNAVFNLPFQITNNSHWFTMYNVNALCGFGRVEDSDGRKVHDLSAGVRVSGKIKPGDYALWTCPIKLGKIVHLDMNIRVMFELRPVGSLYPFEYEYRSPVMSWGFDSEGKPHWELGTKLNAPFHEQ